MKVEEIRTNEFTCELASGYNASVKGRPNDSFWKDFSKDNSGHQVNQNNGQIDSGMMN